MTDRREDDDVITDNDRDPGNLWVRAGYLKGMAEKTSGDDRLFLLRASRSLRAWAEEKRIEDKSKETQ